MNILLFIGLGFTFTLAIGRYLEKIRIPWIFGALLFGFVLAVHNPFSSITTSSEFIFLSKLGMYLLLFLIGLELNIGKLKKLEGFLFKSTFLIIFIEAIIGSILIHFVFNYNFLISFFTALSFATVGEAILIPILDEFGMVNTSLGQTIIGIGTLDDIVEIALLISLSFFIHSQVNGVIFSTLLSFTILLIVVFFLNKLKIKSSFLSEPSQFFLFSIMIFLLLTGIGVGAKAEALGAILAGISVRNMLPNHILSDGLMSQVKTIIYGLFAPLFFIWVGSSIDTTYLFKYPLLILLVVGVTSLAKLLGSFIVAGKKLGAKKATLLGIGLSVRFSTSIIIIKILFDSGIISAGLYSVVLASNIVFEFIVPFLFSTLLIKWKFSREG